MRDILLLAVLALTGCVRNSDGTLADTPEYTAANIDGNATYVFTPDDMPDVKCIVVSTSHGGGVWCKESKQ